MVGSLKDSRIRFWFYTVGSHSVASKSVNLWWWCKSCPNKILIALLESQRLMLILFREIQRAACCVRSVCFCLQGGFSIKPMEKLDCILPPFALSEGWSLLVPLLGRCLLLSVCFPLTTCPLAEHISSYLSFCLWFSEGSRSSIMFKNESLRIFFQLCLTSDSCSNKEITVWVLRRHRFAMRSVGVSQGSLSKFWFCILFSNLFLFPLKLLGELANCAGDP